MATTPSSWSLPEDGACEWSAIGMSKNFVITAGLITSGATTAFVKLIFPFSPVGKRIELTAYDLDGTVRNSDSFSKIDNLVASP
jgi:hypothetical protein|tara:strand:- start:1340 stop:1591 length:252 start_codon:yes stop_codon:yes gene_type:complete